MKRPDAIIRYRGECEHCPTLRLQVFYRETERNSFVRRHVLTTHHRVTLIEENY